MSPRGGTAPAGPARRLGLCRRCRPPPRARSASSRIPATPPCGRQDIAAGRIDKRVLAALVFLSRSGLKPVVSALRCGHSEYTVSGYVSEHYSGDAVDISAIDGIPIAGHQGPGTITDTTIRTLLTLQDEYAPHQIISLMRYPGAANTLAMADHWDHIHVGYRPVAAAGAPGTATTARAHGRSAPAQPS